MDNHPLIAAALAAPKTHEVVTTYASGAIKRHETRNAASAENFAIGERRKVGRDLIDRDSGETVRVASVEVRGLPEFTGVHTADCASNAGFAEGMTADECCDCGAACARHAL